MKSSFPYNVMRHRSWEVASRDPITVGAAILGPSLTAATTVGSFALGAAVVGYVATTAITSLALNALAPTPEIPELPSIGSSSAPAAANRGTIINSREAAANQEYVYGQVRKGGNIIFMESTGAENKYLHVVIALAGHAVEEIGDIYINDEIVTLSGNTVFGRWGGKIRIKKQDGTQTATDSDLLAETSVTSEFVGNGIAYIYVRLEYDQSIFSGGIPTFTAVVKGKQVENTSGVVQSYPASANAALVIRDYIKSAYGLSDSNVDDTYFAAAATDCDDDIALSGGGTEKRYQINGVVNAGTSIGRALQDMVRACNGTLYLSGGQWRLKVGVYDASVKSLTLDDLRSGISIQTRHSRRNNFNSVIGKFMNAEDDWIESDYPPVTSAAFLAEDNNIENQIDIPLYMITSPSQAQRVAKQILFRSREQMTLVADFGLRAIDLEVGDIIDLTVADYGWDAKEFEVVTWKLFIGDGGGIRVNMTLRETSEAAFDWNAEESAIISNNSNLLRFDESPAVGLSAIATTRVLNEKVTNFITVTVTSALAAQVDYVEVEYKLSTASTYKSLGTGQLGDFEAVDLDNGNYDFRARSVNAVGYYGEWQYLDGVAALGDVDPPDDVTALFAEINGQTLTLDWEPVANPDLSYYRIRHSIAEASATWANATTAVDKVPRPGSSVTLPARAGTYLIRAFDKEGLQSSSATSFVVPSAAMPAFTNTSTQTEHSTFTGTKTGCSVVGGELQITSTSVRQSYNVNNLTPGLVADFIEEYYAIGDPDAPPAEGPREATYEFSTYVDTSAAGRRYCRIRCGTRRQDDSAGLFDELPGQFDSLAGLFDDLTGFNQVADTNVVFYIATTSDDPASSPTWSDWQQFRAGDFYGRAFKFKIVLKSTSTDVTPSVDTLQAIVEWN